MPGPGSRDLPETDDSVRGRQLPAAGDCGRRRPFATTACPTESQASCTANPAVSPSECSGWPLSLVDFLQVLTNTLT